MSTLRRGCWLFALMVPIPWMVLRGRRPLVVLVGVGVVGVFYGQVRGAMWLGSHDVVCFLIAWGTGSAGQVTCWRGVAWLVGAVGLRFSSGRGVGVYLLPGWSLSPVAGGGRSGSGLHDCGGDQVLELLQLFCCESRAWVELDPHQWWGGCIQSLVWIRVRLRAWDGAFPEVRELGWGRAVGCRERTEKVEGWSVKKMMKKKCP